MRIYWALGLVFLAVAAQARVVEVEVQSRASVLGAQPFGEAGAYEKLSGVIRFAFDPDNRANAAIVDIDKAPRNDDGDVVADADFMVLRPVDPRRGARTAWLEVSNRGGKAALRYFNAAERFVPDPEAAADYGDGLLMRLGLTVIWVGWQFDVPDEPGRLRLHVPVVRPDDGSIQGLVRSDWVVDEAVKTLALAHRDHWAYPVADPKDRRNVLTVRDGRESPRQVVPRAAWRFARQDSAGVVPDLTHIYAPDGFEAGMLYELVYLAEDPRLVGLGLAAVRDTMAYAKHDDESLFPVARGIGFGVSQTGRFLRHFLYQGFNVDEHGKRVFDGLLIHTAGAGRGSFNHRFAQPSRDGHRYSTFFYPTDLFPFTSVTQVDPVTERRDGLLAHYHSDELLPRIFYTNSGYEYWGRAAALIHTSVDGERDIDPLPNERIYHLASGQHFVERWPPDPEKKVGPHAWRGNPLDFLVNLRALAARLTAWVNDEREPPPSRYPRIADGTLVPLSEFEFPALAGITPPTVAQVAYRADYGPRWQHGIVDFEPPRLGPAFPVLVPAVDALGNELGGVRNVEVLVPVATYTGWSLRDGLANADELRDFRGLFLPFAPTASDRQERSDPRPPLRERYSDLPRYCRDLHLAASQLVAEGLVLGEDLPRIVRNGLERWQWALAPGEPVPQC